MRCLIRLNWDSVCEDEVGYSEWRVLSKEDAGVSCCGVVKTLGAFSVIGRGLGVGWGIQYRDCFIVKAVVVRCVISYTRWESLLIPKRLLSILFCG